MSSSLTRKTFLTDCVSSDAKSIDDMVDEAKEINFETFRHRCDTLEWERGLGYAVNHEQGMRLVDDYHVTYWRSRYRGTP